MQVDSSSPSQIDVLCETAVWAVMKGGTFEDSGPTRLLVLRHSGLVIAYHTPFNPLPPLSNEQKFLAAKDGRIARLQPYGINIWYENLGKVVRAGWYPDGPTIVDFYRPGEWETLLCKVLESISKPRPAARRQASTKARQAAQSAPDAGSRKTRQKRKSIR